MHAIRTLAAAIVAIAAAMANPALAHPRLLHAAPAQSARLGHVRSISLTFSEPLVGPLSGFDVFLIGMRGTPTNLHRSMMKISGIHVSLAHDGKTLGAVLERPLPAGNYEIRWRAVSTDTHRITGAISFTAR